jgi:hypothetical protein
MVIFYVYMRERAKKSPFYVAYTQIGNLCIENLRMRRKKLCKPSYAYMCICYGAKEITALVWSGASVVPTKQSRVLLSVHLACALLAHFASKVPSLQAKCTPKSTPDRFCNLCPFQVCKYDRVQNATFAPYLRTSFSALES